MFQTDIKYQSYYILIKFIPGRQFQYDRALQIIQEEEYLKDSDLNNIERHDVSQLYKRISKFNPDVNIPKNQQYSNWAAREGKVYKGKFSSAHLIQRQP